MFEIGGHMKEDMVVGFIFSQDKKSVYLIRKEHPEWQNGRLNGIGGHIENGEKSVDAMKREMFEESSVNIDNWNFVCTMNGDSWYLYVYTAFLPVNQKIESKTSEIINAYEICRLNEEKIISSVSFLVPMCLDFLTNKNSFCFAKFLY